MEEDKNLPAGLAGTQPEAEPKENIRKDIISLIEAAMPEAEQALPLKPLNDLTEPMEVHHHTHPPHGKKTWKDYFWEFLMLFLAVFCGFLAEYQLEHYIEKQRAREFAISLHRDLSADTAIFNNTTQRLHTCINKIDTLITLLGQTEAIQKNTTDIYRLSVYAFIFPTTTPNESTLQQLLNSGSLRYFKDDLLVDSIKQYNTEVQLLKSFSDAASNFNIEFRKIQVRLIEIDPLIEFITHNHFLNGQNQALADFRTVDPDYDLFKNQKMLVSDALQLKEYANWCALKKFYLINSVSKYSTVNSRAYRVLSMLRK